MYSVKKCGEIRCRSADFTPPFCARRLTSIVAITGVHSTEGKHTDLMIVLPAVTHAVSRPLDQISRSRRYDAEMRRECELRDLAKFTASRSRKDGSRNSPGALMRRVMGQLAESLGTSVDNTDGRNERAVARSGLTVPSRQQQLLR